MDKIEIPGSAVLSANVTKARGYLHATCEGQREFGEGLGPDYRSWVEFTPKEHSPPCSNEDAARNWVLSLRQDARFF